MSVNIKKWDVEDNEFWESTGKKIANRNLWASIPALLLALFFSPAIAGFYAIAARVMMVPIGLVGNSVRQVFYQSAELIPSGNDNLSNLCVRYQFSSRIQNC